MSDTSLAGPPIPLVAKRARVVLELSDGHRAFSKLTQYPSSKIDVLAEKLASLLSLLAPAIAEGVGVPLHEGPVDGKVLGEYEGRERNPVLPQAPLLP